MKSSTSEPAVSRRCGAHELFETSCARAHRAMARYTGGGFARPNFRKSSVSRTPSADQLVPSFSILSQCNVAGIVHLYRWGVWPTLVHTATLCNSHERILNIVFPKTNVVVPNRMPRTVAVVARSVVIPMCLLRAQWDPDDWGLLCVKCQYGAHG